MKRFLQIGMLSLLIMLGASWRNTASAQDDGDISYQTFYDDLSPYGDWIDNPDYGYVWVPSEPAGFRPYETNGHWVWTDEYEWMWVSDYAWGWAPFHYGRWLDDAAYGWMWVPGYEWSPAWVAWRDGGDYYGWAPLRPGIDISFGFSMGSYNPPIDYWCFAPRQYISSPRIYDYCVEPSRNITIINRTTIINNYDRRNNVFVTGPRRMDAERYAGRINPVRLRDSYSPGRTQFRNNEVSMYHPRVEQRSGQQFAPRNFERYDRSRSRDNGFARGDRNNNFSQRNANNLPDARTDNRIDRRNNNGNNDNRFDRRNIFDGQQSQEQQNNGRRIDRGNNPIQQQDQQRRFDRGQPIDRQQQDPQRQQQMQRQQDQQRQFETQRQNQQQDQQRQLERQQQMQRQQDQQRQRQQQDQQRQFEMQRQSQQQDQQRQLERQQQVQRQQQDQQRQVERQQQQPRQFERPQQMDRRQESQPRPSDNRDQRGNDNGRGHGRRF